MDSRLQAGYAMHPDYGQAQNATWMAQRAQAMVCLKMVRLQDELDDARNK